MGKREEKTTKWWRFVLYFYELHKQLKWFINEKKRNGNDHWYLTRFFCYSSQNNFRIHNNIYFVYIYTQCHSDLSLIKKWEFTDFHNHSETAANLDYYEEVVVEEES